MPSIMSIKCCQSLYFIRKFKLKHNSILTFFSQGEIAGYKVEKGANWIHFAKDEETEPIWQQKKKNKIQGIWSDYSSIIIR